jgi:hypothetical protein
VKTTFPSTVQDSTNHDVSPRRAVATFFTYAEAQRAVDYLSDKKFPVEHVSIVAEGLRMVERVTGRLNWGKAALNGAIGGATTGLFLGFLLGLFFFVAPFITAFVFGMYGLITGLIIGTIVGLIGYALSDGSRDFTSVGSIQADRYVVLVEAAVADEATRLLGMMTPPMASTEPVHSAGRARQNVMIPNGRYQMLLRMKGAEQWRFGATCLEKA